MTPRKLFAAILIALTLIISPLFPMKAQAATSTLHHVVITYNTPTDIAYFHPYDESRLYTNKAVKVSGGYLQMPLGAGDYQTKGPAGWFYTNQAVQVDIKFRFRLVKADESGWGGALFSWPTTQAGELYPQKRGEYNWPEWHPYIDQGHPHFYTHATGNRCVGPDNHVVCPVYQGSGTTGRVDTVKLSDWHVYEQIINGSGTRFLIDGKTVTGTTNSKWTPYGPRRALTAQFGPRAGSNGRGNVTTDLAQFDWMDITWK